MSDLQKCSFVTGQGAVLTNRAGTNFFDLYASAGVVSLGHGDPAFQSKVADMASGLFSCPSPSEARIAFWQAISKWLQPGLDRIYFFSSGTEAVEAALRITMAASGKEIGICFQGAYHGRTAAARGVSGWASDLHHRLPFNGSDESQATIDEALFRSAGFAIVEPIQGTSGNRHPRVGVLHQLRNAVEEFQVPMIVDEIITGAGRTGRWLQSEADNISPDILLLGKGIGNGLPIACLVAKSDLVDRALHADPSLSFSSSFGGNPFVVGVSAFVIEELIKRQAQSHAQAMGAHFVNRLSDAVSKLPHVDGVEGTGLLIGVRFARRSLLETPNLPSLIQKRIFEAGVIVGIAGSGLRINPPLCIDKAQIDKACDALIHGLAETTL